MASLVKVSEAASIALHACLWMARHPGAYGNAREICGELGVSEAHFAKVMQTLGRAGLVESHRGPGGGARLAVRPEAVTLLRIYETVDGPARMESCLLAPEICAAKCCGLGSALAAHNEALRQLLAGTTLAQLAAGSPPPQSRPQGGRPSRRAA